MGRVYEKLWGFLGFKERKGTMGLKIERARSNLTWSAGYTGAGVR